MAEVTIRDAEEKQRFEAVLNGEVVGFAEYRPLAGAVMFTHTEVNGNLEGQGIGSTLIREALEATQKSGRWVIPMCPFVVGFIQRHPEHLDSVKPEHRRVFGM